MSAPAAKPLMGRLFWKFFVFLWLAQLLTAMGVGAMIWLARNEHGSGGFPPTVGFREHPAPGIPTGATMAPGDRSGPPSLPPGPPRLLPPLMPMLAGSIVSLVFAALLAAYFARPIRDLREALGAISEGALDTRVSPRMRERRDELSALGVEFDHMAARLQSVVEGQRRLLHDVSHELRSPLARLQAAADLLRQQPDRSAVFVEQIERDTNRMNRLVGELLTLARLDTGIQPNMDEYVELMRLLAEIAQDGNLEAEASACRIVLDGAGPATVRGNAELIRRALENVIRNALRFSPPGGRIVIHLQHDPVQGRVGIEIADSGPGVAASDLDAMFEPFFRSGAEDTYSGYGLGLAIARQVVKQHGGEIEACNGAGGGLVVRIFLPAEQGRQRPR
ncbi:HAMP domain-containing histidine kinase [Azoarcus sp. L1K30]|uniref:HAMP domain-containing sensor histidine kinase n=1 Tax=Azoarcus sp. L1K30 TaxID=2820277 RepID=UPI001B826F47|nr:HAMP domain-containing sensor histidine kinase [Azoarcus sp. L1K30]MBR0567139.1 HAMP domain-containing histidine kinase [Azoarcus sp. L1K30]